MGVFREAHTSDKIGVGSASYRHLPLRLIFIRKSQDSHFFFPPWTTFAFSIPLTLFCLALISFFCFLVLFSLIWIPSYIITISNQFETVAKHIPLVLRRGECGNDSYLDEPFLGVILLLHVSGVVDEGHSSGSATSILGLESHDGDALGLGLHHAGKLVLDLGSGDGSGFGVDQLDDALLSGQKRILQEFSVV